MSSPQTSRPPSTARKVAGWVLTAAVAAGGGLIGGEYDLHGLTPFIAGALLAVVVAEVQLTLVRGRGPFVASATGALAGSGLAWAVWISTGRGVAPIPLSVWGGIAFCMVAADAWVLIAGGGRAS